MSVVSACTKNDVIENNLIPGFKNAITEVKLPFDIFSLDCGEIISIVDAFKLRTALLSMNFKKKSCDLYSFSQSSDFNLMQFNQLPQEVQKFLELLKKIKLNIAAYLNKTFNDVISVSCSKYDNGDYLLCHDDRVENRSVAFVYYLNYDWLPDWGGSLDLYSVDENFNAKAIEHKVNPAFNSMIFFPVGNNTYHQVAENLSNFSRISINGWFHCDELEWEMGKPLRELPSPIYLPHNVPHHKLNDSLPKLIEGLYFDPVYRDLVCDMFTKDGFIMCVDFFKPTMIDILTNEIFSSNLDWKVKGPLNKRCYKYIAQIDKLPLELMVVINILKTDFMFKFFKDCTGLDFDGVSIEVQSWHGGHYMVSGGEDELDNFLSVYFFFSHCFGEMSDEIKEHMHYVFEERDTLEAKFACKPRHNSIFMVNRSSNIESYIKYCKKVEGHGWTAIVANYLLKTDVEIQMKNYIKV